MNNLVLTDFYEIHNSKDGKTINFTIDSKVKKFKTVRDAAVEAYKHSQELFDSEKYLNSTSKQEIEAIRRTKSKSLEDAFVEQFEKELIEYLNVRKEIRDDYIQSALPSAFRAKFIPAKFSPSSALNEIDKMFVENIVYNVEQDSIYSVSNDSYQFIGTLAEVINKDSKTLFKLTNILDKELSIKYSVESFELWSFMYDQLDKVTEAFFKNKIILEQIDQSNKNVDINSTLNMPWKKDASIAQFVNLKTMRLKNNWLDELHSYFVKNIFEHVIPASGVNAGLYNVFFETTDDETFKRYAVKPIMNKKCTFELFIANLFSERYTIVKSIKHIDAVPKVISDDNTPAEFHYNTNWLDGLTDQVSFEDAKILNAFLSPYADEERIAIMAWAYSVFHPSLNDNIHFLFKTGGGTFKTNYYCEMLRTILKLAYQSRELCLVLKGDRWISDSFLKETPTIGISNAALVNADECTDKCLEEFKSMTGGTSKGMDYQKRVMRENPISMKIYSKWLLTTNKDFIVTDNDGAFERRLLIINRHDVKNIAKPYSAAEFEKHFSTEVKAFYEYSEQCYNKIRETANTIQEYRDSNSIRKYMNETYKESEKIMAYNELLAQLENIVTDKQYVKNRLIVHVDQFNAIAEHLCKKYEINVAGFRKWIRETEDTEVECKYAPVRVNGDIRKCWQLAKLKQDVIDKLNASADELDDAKTTNVQIT